MPALGTSAEGPEGRRALWWARGMAMVTGPRPEGLKGLAAVTEQSGAWVRVALTGEGAGDALARLVPVDLRPAVLPPGAVRRTLIGHIAGAVVGADGDHEIGGHEIWAPRSMAGTLAHDLARAMGMVAARRRLFG